MCLRLNKHIFSTKHSTMTLKFNVWLYISTTVFFSETRNFQINIDKIDLLHEYKKVSLKLRNYFKNFSETNLNNLSTISKI